MPAFNEYFSTGETRRFNVRGAFFRLLNTSNDYPVDVTVYDQKSGALENVGQVHSGFAIHGLIDYVEITSDVNQSVQFYVGGLNVLYERKDVTVVNTSAAAVLVSQKVLGTIGLWDAATVAGIADTSFADMGLPVDDTDCKYLGIFNNTTQTVYIYFAAQFGISDPTSPLVLAQLREYSLVLAPGESKEFTDFVPVNRMYINYAVDSTEPGLIVWYDKNKIFAGKTWQSVYGTNWVNTQNDPIYPSAYYYTPPLSFANYDVNTIRVTFTSSMADNHIILSENNHTFLNTTGAGSYTVTLKAAGPGVIEITSNPYNTISVTDIEYLM